MLGNFVILIYLLSYKSLEKIYQNGMCRPMFMLFLTRETNSFIRVSVEKSK